MERCPSIPLIASLLLGGCAIDEPSATGVGDEAFDDAPGDDAWSRTGRFLVRRGMDLSDIASVRVSFGPGLLAQARASRWLAAGVGSIGPDTPWGGGFSFIPHFLGWGLRDGGVWTERRAEVGLSTMYYCEAEVDVISGIRDRIGIDSRGTWDAGAELHFALVGVAAEVRPDELLDFVAGWVGNDPAFDDR